ncbi:MAG: MFS transporter [Christensenellaceae bacterium]|jgi:Na+/melibiose symporter-like transporter|nr:MFS transporter [Christensenellaceae bacterium]
MKNRNIFNYIAKGTSFLKSNWKTPKEGRYVSIKEFLAYSLGGMGVYGASCLVGYTALTAGVYLAASLNIDSTDIWLISIISSIITIIRSPFLSKIIDNTNTKFGKFRPYLISMPFPILIFTILLSWVTPLFSYNRILMLIVFTIIFNLQQFFLTLYNVAFSTSVQVISPVQNERELLMGLGSTIYSLGATLTNLLFPLIANIMFSAGADGGGVNSIDSFKWILPIMLVIFFSVGYFMAFGIKERVITAKLHTNKIGFLAGIKDTFKNKYFLLSNASSVLNFASAYLGVLQLWICTYLINTKWALGVFSTLIGAAYAPAMLSAPFLMKKFGKRKVVLACNFLTGLFVLPMIFLVDIVSPYLLIAMLCLIRFFNGAQVITGPALNSQINDFQQFKTGKRAEGYINQYSTLIATAFSIGLGFLPPLVYHSFGFFEDSTVLYNSNILYPILRTLSILVACSAIASAVPMFFWDLSEKRHAKIMEILKLRAQYEDGSIDKELAQQNESTLISELYKV